MKHKKETGKRCIFCHTRIPEPEEKDPQLNGEGEKFQENEELGLPEHPGRESLVLLVLGQVEAVFPELLAGCIQLRVLFFRFRNSRMTKDTSLPGFLLMFQRGLSRGMK